MLVTFYREAMQDFEANDESGRGCRRSVAGDARRTGGTFQDRQPAGLL